MINRQDSRHRIKRSNLTGVVPTVPTSSDFTDGTWLNTDLRSGELFWNEADNQLFIGATGQAFEIALVGGTGSGNSLEQTLAIGNSAGTYSINGVKGTLDFNLFGSSVTLNSGDWLNSPSLLLDPSADTAQVRSSNAGGSILQVGTGSININTSGSTIAVNTTGISLNAVYNGAQITEVVKIGDNRTVPFSTTNSNKPGIIINSRNSTMGNGAVNSVIIGGLDNTNYGAGNLVTGQNNNVLDGSSQYNILGGALSNIFDSTYNGSIGSEIDIYTSTNNLVGGNQISLTFSNYNLVGGSQITIDSSPGNIIGGGVLDIVNTYTSIIGGQSITANTISNSLVVGQAHTLTSMDASILGGLGLTMSSQSYMNTIGFVYNNVAGSYGSIVSYIQTTGSGPTGVATLNNLKIPTDTAYIVEVLGLAVVEVAGGLSGAIVGDMRTIYTTTPIYIKNVAGTTTVSGAALSQGGDAFSAILGSYSATSNELQFLVTPAIATGVSPDTINWAFRVNYTQVSF